ncbi:MAG TPA: DUF4386 domain-containing protein [Rhizomicrobium sp.]|nr:DUF4386 domain-containing protein [Rhizomicrobium sp.]
MQTAGQQQSGVPAVRLAGFLYALIIAGALFAPFPVVPSGMMHGDATLPTIAQIMASKPNYVLGGIAQLFLGACDVGVAVILYQLLAPVGKGLSLFAAALRIVFVAIANANVLNHFAPLLILSGASYLSAFRPDQLQALALAFIRLRTVGLDIALVFFGFHCIVAGYLIFRSTFLPRILGLLLMIGGIGYMANILAGLLPTTTTSLIFPYIMLPAGVAEISLSLWLMIAGVNVARWRSMFAAASNRTA